MDPLFSLFILCIVWLAFPGKKKKKKEEGDNYIILSELNKEQTSNQRPDEGSLYEDEGDIDW